MHVPGYQIMGQLGRGGQAAVFRARMAGGLDVALKLFPANQTERALGRFRREAQAMRAIAHPGVVRVLDHGVADGRPFMALELVDGVSLSEAIVRGLSLETVLDVATQLAEALSAVHAAGIAHRDVKPDNVLLADGRAVLADFGLALFGAGGAHSLTQSGALLGTPAYMAPEMATGKLSLVGPAADVYAWGATVFEAVTQRPPFSGDSLVGLLRAIAEDRPPRLRAIRPDAPAWLAELVAACLAKSPDARPADGAALVAAIARAQPRAAGLREGKALALALTACLLLALGVGAAVQAGPPPVKPKVAQSREQRDDQPDPATRNERTLEIRLDPLRGHDTFVDGWAFYTNDNFGAERRLYCGVRAARNMSAPRLSYLAFPLDQLPAGARVTSAVLELCEPNPMPDRAAVGAYTVLEPWVEGGGGLDGRLDGVAWGEGHQPLTNALFARPEHDDLALDVAEAPSQGQPARWDLTAAVRQWLSDPRTNLGVCLAPLPSRGRPTDGVRYRTFHSRDAKRPEDRPRLVVRYVGPAAKAVTPFAERLAAHRQRVSATLREAARLPAGRRLVALNELLGAMPSDLDARAMRVRAFLELGLLEIAVQDARVLSRVSAGAATPRACAVVVELIEAVEQGALATDKRFLAWEACWAVLDANTAPDEPLPSRPMRLDSVERRLASNGDVRGLQKLYRRGRVIWPQDTKIQEELEALPTVCLTVAKLLLDHPQRRERLATQIASAALELLDCTHSQRKELQLLLEESR